jgi:hypothetical protein
LTFCRRFRSDVSRANQAGGGPVIQRPIILLANRIGFSVKLAPHPAEAA